MNKKAVTFGAVVLAMSTAVAAGSSLAYFTDSEDVTNTFTVGDVDIDLTEPLWNPTEEHIISPGAEIAKNPTVTNAGINDAYIRVKVTISDFDTMKSVIPSFAGAVDSNIITGFDKTSWDIVSEEDSGNDHIVTLLYKNILSNKSESNSVQVFSGLNIPTELDGELQALAGKNPTITVSAEAIQANGFEDVYTAFEAYAKQINN